MDAVGGPDAKKARWSPTSAYSSQNNGSTISSNSRDAFANYGYGPQASIAQPTFNSASGPTANGTAGFAGSPLYSTPSLSVSAPTNGVMNPQLSPNAVAAFAVQQQQNQIQAQQQQAQGSPNGTYNAFNAYGMLGMGMPMGMLNGFPYNGQMGNFGQVRCILHSLKDVFLLYNVANAVSHPQCAQWPECRRLFPCCTYCSDECLQ